MVKFLQAKLSMGKSSRINHLQQNLQNRIEPYTPDQLEEEKEKLNKRWGGIIPVFRSQSFTSLMVDPRQAYINTGGSPPTMP